MTNVTEIMPLSDLDKKCKDMVNCNEDSLEKLSKSYFRSISALAEKIADDVDLTSKTYQNFWYTLSDNERKQAINDRIIDPTVVIKYAYCNDLVANQYYPYSHSWFTKSQLDLFKIFQSNEEWLLKCDRSINSANYVFRKNALSATESDCAALKENSGVASFDMFDILSKMKNKVTGGCKTNSSVSKLDEKLSLINNSNNKITICKAVIPKPKIPPPAPPFSKPMQAVENSNLLNDNEQFIDNNEIPKTGFDFLDNW